MNFHAPPPARKKPILPVGFIEPAAPTLKKVPAGPDWLHEIKHDGYG